MRFGALNDFKDFYFEIKFMFNLLFVHFKHTRTKFHFQYWIFQNKKIDQDEKLTIIKIEVPRLHEGPRNLKWGQIFSVVYFQGDIIYIFFEI